jgi:hypothetical protein
LKVEVLYDELRGCGESREVGLELRFQGKIYLNKKRRKRDCLEKYQQTNHKIRS